MIRRRSGIAVGVLNGFLYALGGLDSPASNPSVCRTHTVERYDPCTDKWDMVRISLEIDIQIQILKLILIFRLHH